MKSLNRIITPLNFLAIFAALSEASAATTLPYLDEESRKFFIGFIIVFPCVLSAMWFFVMRSHSRTAIHPTEPECLTDRPPISRVVHAGFLSTSLDAAQLTLFTGAAPTALYKKNQFEVLLIQHT